MSRQTQCSLILEANKPGGRRGVGFLVCDLDNSVTAHNQFVELKKEEQRWLRTILDWWIHGGKPNNNWFHGFNKPEFKACFVFKNGDHRFYGLLCHPKKNYPKDEDRRYHLCALIAHAAKHTWETEENYLHDCVNREFLVHQAAKKLFGKVPRG